MYPSISSTNRPKIQARTQSRQVEKESKGTSTAVEVYDQFIQTEHAYKDQSVQHEVVSKDQQVQMYADVKEQSMQTDPVEQTGQTDPVEQTATQQDGPASSEPDIAPAKTRGRSAARKKIKDEAEKKPKKRLSIPVVQVPKKRRVEEQPSRRRTYSKRATAERNL